MEIVYNMNVASEVNRRLNTGTVAAESIQLLLEGVGSESDTSLFDIPYKNMIRFLEYEDNQ